MDDLVTLLGANPNATDAARILAPFDLALHVEPPFEAGMEPEAYLQSLKHGIQIQLGSDVTIRTIFLFAEGKDSFTQFKGALGSGLSFASVREDVENALGTPSRSAPPERSLLGGHGGWVRYDNPFRSLHFSFSYKSTAIELVTIMRPEIAPQ